MTDEFDQAYWNAHWQQAGHQHDQAHPYLAVHTDHLAPGTALEAGCGEGNEARWLAQAGWTVTGADLSATALARARERTDAEQVQWVEADLQTWTPDHAYDLVSTHYAHPRTGQLDFYARLAGWVAPGGTLLVVGHLQPGTVTADLVSATLEAQGLRVVSAQQVTRSMPGHGADLQDVVVRAQRPR